MIRYANKNIYDQQIQMAKFLNRYYNNSTVIANDIGAISYFTNIKLIDLVGLGSNEILNIKTNDPKQFDKKVALMNYDLMIISEEWFDANKFGNRVKIAELKISNNHICWSDKVSFYFPSNKEKSNIYKVLENFKNKELPKDVTLTIFNSK